MPTTKRRTIGAVVVAITACAFMSASPVQAAVGKPSPPTGPAVSEGAAPDRDATSPVPITPGTERALAKIRERTVKYVARHGTKNTFAIYADTTTGRIVLTTDAPTDVVSALTNMAGQGAEEKAAVGRMQVKRQAVTDVWHRRDDIQPYWGGGGITSNGKVCSAGYTVRNAAGTRFMVTAGHCFNNGAGVRTESLNNYYGSVSNRHLPTVSGDPKDMELIGNRSYAGRIYTGGVTSTSSLRVVAAGEAYVGYTNYCHSGRTTGENCGHTATSITATVCTQSGCKYPVIAFTGGNMIQGGDSGSPFYAKNSYGAWIRGHSIASGGGTGYAEKWTKVAPTLGVSIVTG